MCGIAGLQLFDPALHPQLGSLMAAMLHQVCERGPDSAGVALYGDPDLTPPGLSAVSLLGVDDPAADADLSTVVAGETTVVRGSREPAELELLARQAFPEATVIGRGHELAVLKGTGHPDQLAVDIALGSRQGWQGLAHTRMATESAVTSAHSHPFSVADDLCLVHNGSFANHATIRRELIAEGAVFDSDNDSEVGARFLAARMAEGNDLEKSLRLLCETFDGFYTLVVTTADTFAVVRDAIACKPAILAVTEQWVAMASEYRALAQLPGIGAARIFEPEPEEVYTWRR
ncbi:glutamate synthase domain-containing protein 1 [Motilibacter peucedani]|uniref:glutamine--fructose-6-phosphate transaminase (isomerizing) n=1 Tax=Motilibacter peucedani TaxID=598650 RepID=A0A420XUH3_9ACTN|nr:glutamine amidotransferase [Motilibacter peucedani]RKS80503.1 glutamate synthase domain-containing protein 1 [Motilibacter peucedani]